METSITKTMKKDESGLTTDEFQKMRYHEFEEYNINPYPHFFETNFHLRNFTKYSELKNDETIEETLKVSGRVILKRSSSKKLYFYTIESDGCNIQIMSSRIKYHDTEEFKQINQVIRRGDIIGVEGYPHRSRSGELSIIPHKLILLSPCMNLLPKDGKTSTFTNKETRFRHRHLDWIMNPQRRDILKTRSKIIRFIRNYFNSRDFFEVETPILNTVYGGACAKPFTTFINAFSMPMFMRIAPELRLKQMIIGGFERVYEIGKQFRNECVDLTHLPEFTSIEFYQQGADYHTLMKTTEELLSSLVDEIHGTHKIKYHLRNPDDEIEEELEIDFTPPFRKIDMKETLIEKIKSILPEFELPDDLSSESSRLYFSGIMDELKIECSPPRTMARMLDKLVGEFIEPECINPTFIINHFQVMSPLAKYHREDPTLTERFELFVGRKELCNAFTELNDPVVQEKLFMAQVEDKKLGDDEAQMKDDEFVEALKYGQIGRAHV
jgi:lysyl-tRNA synthetase class 2